MNSIESFSQNTDAETFMMSAFSTFFIIIYDDTWTETEKTVMTEYHWRMIQIIDFFNSIKIIVKSHDNEKQRNDYILLLK